MPDHENLTTLTRTGQRVKAGSPRIVAATLVSVLLLGAVPLTALWQISNRIAGAVTTVKASAIGETVLTTPLMSARRTPTILSNEIRIGGLRNGLRPIVARLPEQSCLIVAVDGRNVVEANVKAPLIPASNQKILVAAVALEVLGPDFRYSTKILGIANGATIEGDLWIVGGGDPLLTAGDYPSTEVHPTLFPTAIEPLIDALVSAGITNVSGSIVGDESRYDSERFTPSLGLGIRGTELGPLGALLLNDGVIATSPIKPDNPALSTAIEFTRLLTERGIAVAGAPNTGTASQDLPVIATVSSAPLTDVITEMLTNSDNNTAELLLKELGRSDTTPGTRISGIAVVLRVLQESNIDIAELAMTDGSGLDRSNRVTCTTLQSILVRDGGFGPLTMGFAVAGRSGTLSELFLNGPMSGVMRGKTGTLTGAKTLSAVIPYSDNQAIIFSILLNGPGVSNQSSYRPIWLSLTEALAKFSLHPTAGEISPLAARDRP
ncbi:MAG: D-alanyl-D-alanine carboxypeptidase/D-alanyl-D-alanine-endopeptidase [Ilumatobacteraceae bacterium]